MENEEEKYLLSLVIDGRKYPPLSILKSEEEAYRGAAKIINNRINRYRVAYGDSSGFDSQDFMAMTAIQALVKSLTLGTKNNTKPYEDKISSLIDELDQYLSK